MPPIKRTQKPASTPARRRLAGHVGPTKPESDAAGSTAAPAGATGDRREKGRAAGNTTPASSTGSRRGREAAGASATSIDASRTGRALGRPLAYAALAIGVVAGGFGVYLATEPGVDVQNQAFVDSAETDAVLSAATANVQRLVAIDHETLDEYHDSLGEFLTPNLVTDLDENWPALKDSYEQTATSVDAEVREAGLSYLEGDKAEVLLVQDVSMTRDGAAAGSTSGTYLVGLDKVDGVWKLSKIPDLPS